MPESTQKSVYPGGIFDLHHPRLGELFHNFIISLFSVGRHNDVVLDYMCTPQCCQEHLNVLFRAIVDPNGIEVYNNRSLGAEEIFILH